MLLQFTAENYLSFRDRAVLSMLADPRVEHDAGQVIEGPAGKKVLRAAAVYGANGSGKSNLFKALQAVRRMVTTGTRRKEALPVVPFKLDATKRGEPSRFEIEVGIGDKHYSYGFEATPEQVMAEWLYEVGSAGEGQALFTRQTAGDDCPIRIEDALANIPKRREFLEHVAVGTRKNQLFLAEAGEHNVKELDSIRLAIDDWRLVAPDTPFLALPLDRLEKIEELRTMMSEILQKAGTGIDGLRVASEPAPDLPNVDWTNLLNPTLARNYQELQRDDGGRVTGKRLMSIHRSPDGPEVELEFGEESDGTKRLLDLAPIVYYAMRRDFDPFFVIDELERSLHPLLTRLLLQLFFTQAQQGAAQIIFTTHDTNLLHRGLLRRDSVWFIDKDVRGGSILYPLTDMDQGQVDELEKQGRGLERAYLQGRFGALPFFRSLLGLRKQDLK
jgi:AAA15 family ATPase/GTPase